MPFPRVGGISAPSTRCHSSGPPYRQQPRWAKSLGTVGYAARGRVFVLKTCAHIMC
ncbi:MAG: CxxxxCH/CxxCH domain-containing protein [Acidobacteriia bacterium]|nr:CxxxxCH/CxxCH domain-containing protein [Terriglobia bacterium]